MYRLIIVEAKVIAGDRCEVVGLGGMGVCVVFGQGDALAFEVGEMRVKDYFGIVLESGRKHQHDSCM